MVIHDFYFIQFHFVIALAIILDYSFYLWDSSPSNSIEFLISAIDVYKSSGNHMTVTEAIDIIFEEQERLLFEKGQDSRSSSNSTFARQLTEVALKNRLCMFHFVQKNLSNLYFSSPSSVIREQEVWVGSLIIAEE